MSNSVIESEESAMQARVLTLEHIHKSYRGKRQAVTALDDISLQVEPGELVVVQGPSGSGKTTLLLTAGGLLAPDQGDVVVDGQSLGQLDSEARARFRAQRIGFVFQQFHLVPYLTVRENVLAPALAYPRAKAGERADELIAAVGLDHRAEHRPAELSTGEKQRAALARALFHQPQLLLADEPTGNLDPDHGRQILAGLKQFAAAGGAILLVSHDPALAEHGRVLRLQGGRLR